MFVGELICWFSGLVSLWFCVCWFAWVGVCLIAWCFSFVVCIVWGDCGLLVVALTW